MSVRFRPSAPWNHEPRGVHGVVRLAKIRDYKSHYAGVAQWLERLLAMQKVVGSSPITRSSCSFGTGSLQTLLINSNVSVKIDFHNHTIYSHDSVNRLKDFEKAHEEGKIDVVAITDHNTIEGALLLTKSVSFPVIVGEEISSTEGDIIGLFLKEPIAPHLSATETAQAIREQKGLVYIPHPFDRLKLGMQPKALQNLGDKGLVDLVEVYNDAFQSLVISWNNGSLPQFIKDNRLIAAAGSDSHIPRDIGRAFVEVSDNFAPYQLANSPDLLMQAVKQGVVTGTTRFSILSLVTKTYGHFRRKLIKEPKL